MAYKSLLNLSVTGLHLEHSFFPPFLSGNFGLLTTDARWFAWLVTAVVLFGLSNNYMRLVLCHRHFAGEKTHRFYLAVE